ncbi:hypothetical protein A2Y83_05475 [Candidatus Falkowbacteria bacterium RBG_13_39_14]|uniref:Uncharacterized protein n=1 Tax=Candidatus Falkowbacteria bacterium RBG_13_39_14 TaxID=1797985 RepID=A0A1F5S7G3_9BACT|nr:MAG: hypothetical protein A2Y83_05475 [Candidatus Falkowbacteria bacterium RBG_13_39_14]
MIDFIKIGHWSFIGGLVLAALAAFLQLPYIAIILFILGLIVGFLNIKETENVSLLVAIISLLIIGFVFSQNAQLSRSFPFIEVLLNNLVTFISAAGIVIAIKQILIIGQANKE